MLWCVVTEGSSPVTLRLRRRGPADERGLAPPLPAPLLKVGLPGAKEGLSEQDPTLAELLKPSGYRTAQFGKNHLGDRNEFIPTVHGFDEFFGNLYHLNAEDEPEHADYPKDPTFYQHFGPRGVLKCVATDRDDATEDPRFGKIGKQRCENGLVNLLRVHMRMRQEPTWLPPVVHLRPWYGSLWGPARCPICAASLAGRPTPTSDAVADGSIGRWGHRLRGSAARVPGT
jgi:hypothetical protein